MLKFKMKNLKVNMTTTNGDKCDVSLEEIEYEVPAANIGEVMKIMADMFIKLEEPRLIPTLEDIKRDKENNTATVKPNDEF